MASLGTFTLLAAFVVCAYVAAAALGLYAHYFAALVLALLNGGALLWALLARVRGRSQDARPALLSWLLAQLASIPGYDAASCGERLS